MVVTGLAVQTQQCSADLRGRDTPTGEPGREQAFFDVGVALAIRPVAQVAPAQFVAEQREHTVLRGAFGLSDRGHGWLLLGL